MKIDLCKKQVRCIFEFKICMCRLLYHEALGGKFTFHKLVLYQNVSFCLSFSIVPSKLQLLKLHESPKLNKVWEYEVDWTDTVLIFLEILSAVAIAPPQQIHGLAWHIDSKVLQGQILQVIQPWKILPGTSWFNSVVNTCCVSQGCAISSWVNMALWLICSVCCFKKHQGFMQETLMGADKEWIYSFSTWDDLLPGGTQLTSDWHTSLCQQSAE